jgi:hypothetical protein
MDRAEERRKGPAMATTRLKKTIQEPCFALFRRNNRWEQVKVTHCIIESGGVIKNAVVCPDGTELEVLGSRLRHDGRIKRFIRHPGA